MTDVNLVVSIQQLALLSALGNQLSDLVAQKQEAPAPIQSLKVGTDSGVESEQPQNSSDRCCRSFHWSKKNTSVMITLIQGSSFWLPSSCASGSLVDLQFTKTGRAQV